MTRPGPHQMGLFGAVEQPTKEAILEQLTGRKAPAPEIGETRQAAALPAAPTSEAKATAPAKTSVELARGTATPGPDQLKPVAPKAEAVKPTPTGFGGSRSLPAFPW